MAALASQWDFRCDWPGCKERTIVHCPHWSDVQPLAAIRERGWAILGASHGPTWHLCRGHAHHGYEATRTAIKAAGGLVTDEV